MQYRSIYIDSGDLHWYYHDRVHVHWICFIRLHRVYEHRVVFTLPTEYLLYCSIFRFLCSYFVIWSLYYLPLFDVRLPTTIGIFNPFSLNDKSGLTCTPDWRQRTNGHRSKRCVYVDICTQRKKNLSVSGKGLWSIGRECRMTSLVVIRSTLSFVCYVTRMGSSYNSTYSSSNSRHHYYLMDWWMSHYGCRIEGF